MVSSQAACGGSIPGLPLPCGGGRAGDRKQLLCRSYAAKIEASSGSEQEVVSGDARHTSQEQLKICPRVAVDVGTYDDPVRRGRIPDRIGRSFNASEEETLVSSNRRIRVD